MIQEPNLQSIIRIIVSELSKHGVSTHIETEVIGDGRTKITQCNDKIVLDFEEHDRLVKERFVKQLKKLGKCISGVRYK